MSGYVMEQRHPTTSALEVVVRVEIAQPETNPAPILVSLDAGVPTAFRLETKAARLLAYALLHTANDAEFEKYAPAHLAPVEIAAHEADELLMELGTPERYRYIADRIEDIERYRNPGED